MEYASFDRRPAVKVRQNGVDPQLESVLPIVRVLVHTSQLPVQNEPHELVRKGE
jgi:hypothetical protein